MNNRYYGLQIVENKLLIKEIKQNRIHKKKRINKKWFKKYGFIEIPDNNCYIMEDKIICHPKIAIMIRDQIRRMN